MLICSNTMHRVADDVEAAIGVPLLHIADATGRRVKAAALSRVGLLGTKPTMEEHFYRGHLADRYGIEVLIPDESDREIVHRLIYDELCRGVVRPD